MLRGDLEENSQSKRKVEENDEVHCQVFLPTLNKSWIKLKITIISNRIVTGGGYHK